MSTAARTAASRARPRGRRPREEYEATPWAVAIGCGILGGIFGRRIFTKHFQRAGIA